MAELAWGKPTIKAKKIGSNGAPTGSWIDIPTPVKDSTKLVTSKGEKKEAKVEGGDNEAVKYASNNYALEFSIRTVDGRADWVPDSDGLVAGEYMIALQPQNSKIKGVKLDRCVISVEDEYSAEEGFSKKYTCDALVPPSGDKCKREVITFS